MKTLKLFVILSLISSYAFAQKSINSHTFSFSDTLETVQVEDALGPDSELAQHRFILRGAYDFVNESLIGIDATRTVEQFPIVKRLHSASVGAGWLITPRILVGFEVPMHYVRLDKSYLSNYGLALDTTKWRLGDINLHAKIRLTSDESKVNVALMPYAFFPTGNNTYFISDDSYGIGGKVLIDFTPIKVLSIYGNAGYTYAKNAKFLNIDRSKRIESAAGAFVRVLPKLGINAEVIHSLTLPGYDKDQNPISYRLGFRAQTGIVRWYFGGGMEGLRHARSNDLTFYGGMKVPFGSWKKPAPVAAAPIVQSETITIEKKIQILKENLSVRREINFETDKDIILPGSYGELDSAAEIINKYEQYIKLITIEGHCDSRGSDAYNMDLSQRRANSVKQYLVGKGVPAAKLQAIGYGERRPKVKEVNIETLLMNRRVEFKVNETIETKNETSESSSSKTKK